ncbi:MAG: thiolase family protein [Planctomycetes bacterium]|nr:thiolase family protein [Planctomycetota bacterium]
MNESNNQKIVIVSGTRTPFLRCNTQFKNTDSSELAKIVIRDLIDRLEISPEIVDTAILGTTNSSTNAMNLARESSIRAGLTGEINASTISKGFGSSIEAITSAIERIRSGKASVVIAGGADNISQTRVRLDEKLIEHFSKKQKSRSEGKNIWQKILGIFNPGTKKLAQSIKDEKSGENPVSGDSFLHTGEKLARKFGIPRREQDNFAMHSHLKIQKAIEENRLNPEMTTTYAYPEFTAQGVDNCQKSNISLQYLKKQKPAVDSNYGSITFANSQQPCDGAAVVLLMTEEKAISLGLKPMGYIEHYTFASVNRFDESDAEKNEGLSAVFAIDKLLSENNIKLDDIDLFEINEITAAHVQTYREILKSKEFCSRILHRDAEIGEIPDHKINCNGGTIAYGNPPGATGVRLVLSAVFEMARSKQNRALIASEIDGSQGVALIIKKLEKTYGD